MEWPENTQNGKRIQFEVNFNIGDSWQKRDQKQMWFLYYQGLCEKFVEPIPVSMNIGQINEIFG